MAKKTTKVKVRRIGDLRLIFTDHESKTWKFMHEKASESRRTVIQQAHYMLEQASERGIG